MTARIPRHRPMFRDTACDVHMTEPAYLDDTPLVPPSGTRRAHGESARIAGNLLRSAWRPSDGYIDDSPWTLWDLVIICGVIGLLMMPVWLGPLGHAIVRLAEGM